MDTATTSSSTTPATSATDEKVPSNSIEQRDGVKTNPPKHKPPLVKSLSFIEFLTLEGLELEFDMGTVQLPNHGTHEFKGYIPVFKKYTPPKLDKFPEVDTILQKWARDVQIPWTRSEISGPKSFVKTAIAATAFFNPKDSIAEPPMVGAAGFCLCIIYLDDILDKSGSFGGVATAPRRRNSLTLTPVGSSGSKKPTSNSNEFTNMFLSTVFDILDGLYSSVEELPEVMPALDPIYKLLFLSYEYGVKGLPAYSSENCKYLRKAFLHDSIAALLMKDLDYANYYTDEVYRMLRPRDGGFYTVIELILLGRGVILRQHVRKHPLFKIIMYLGASALAIANDLFGLEKEVHDGNDNDNLVLRIARHKGIEEAFKEVNDILQNQRKDIELTADKLMDEFSRNEIDSQPLTDFIDILQTFLDGHVYFSQYSERYGKFTLKSTTKL